jgi:hypothetical protein
VDKFTILSDGYAGHANACEKLDRRYRQIGISAVAAAVRYQGEAKAMPEPRNDDQVATPSAA